MVIKAFVSNRGTFAFIEFCSKSRNQRDRVRVFEYFITSLSLYINWVMTYARVTADALFSTDGVLQILSEVAGTADHFVE